MTENAAIVERFVQSWNALDWDAVFAALHPDIVYHNIPWAPVEGLAAVRDNLLGFGVKAAEWTIHALAVNGSTVLTERTDRVLIGGHWAALRVMGAFEIEDGLIRAWRDYFDPSELAPPPA